jgi:hypothetical protein
MLASCYTNKQINEHNCEIYLQKSDIINLNDKLNANINDTSLITIRIDTCKIEIAILKCFRTHDKACRGYLYNYHKIDNKFFADKVIRPLEWIE